MKKIFFAVYTMLTMGCTGNFNNRSTTGSTTTDSLSTVQLLPTDTPAITKNEEAAIVKDTFQTVQVNIHLPVDSIVNFAETLIGTPYKYGSINPAEGFDCSGFITYVFNHFNIEVPRSSIDFTNVGTEILLADAKRGDLILFTGTDSTIEVVGHMGIVTEQTDGVIIFIHSTSGKAYGVTISALTTHYKKRFVKIIRIPLVSNMKDN